MRWKQNFIPTVKEDPQDAEAISHKLMIRGGLIRRLTSGAYIYLPAGKKILEKASRIIREEMNDSGALEILMPSLHPAELWKRTGRYEDMGEVMIRFNDRHGKEIALGPTHEEVVTDLASKEIRSYKDLPVTLYQIQTKFRDEVRPRFGIVRSCEFIMKDAYSFDVDEENMEASYRKMYDAYCRIFERCGLPYVAVEADPGLMGGTVSHEFMIPCDIGEDRIVICSSCEYAASTEVAAISPIEHGADISADLSGKPEEIKTPGKSSVEDVCAFLDKTPRELIKTLIYVADGTPLAVLVRGDHHANEAKIRRAMGVKTLELVDGAGVKKMTGGDMGFSGPVGLDIKIAADNSVRHITSAVTGANHKDMHLINVRPGKDFKVDSWIDARMITGEDLCPKCGGGIEMKNAIEIGHTFKLGTKYSAPLEACYTDKKGSVRPLVMGCYGIGVNRILASIVETSHDKDGMIWPAVLSPAEVIVIPLKMNDDDILKTAESVYNELKEANIDVIIDDRERSPGIKFKDADLVGFPVQIVIGQKCLAENKVEIIKRRGKSSELTDRADHVGRIREILSERR